MISVLTLALAPTFFVMLLGYTAGRAGIVNNMHVAELNTVVMGYALPASLLVATASTPRSALIAQWPVLVSLAADPRNSRIIPSQSGNEFFARSRGAHCACLGSCSVEADCIGTRYWDFDIAHRVAPASCCISSPTRNRTSCGRLSAFCDGLSAFGTAFPAEPQHYVWRGHRQHRATPNHV